MNPHYGRRFSRDRDVRREDEHRINYHIRVPQVRVMRGEESLGIMPTDQARRIAMDEGMDLVEIAPTAKPPVCRIMDYGRYKYEQNIKKKEAAKKQREAQSHLKEIRLRPGIADHDTDTKIAQAKKFLEEGNKVQFNLLFRGRRELSHKEQGFRVMQRVVDALAELSTVDKAPVMEGNRIVCSFAPKT